MKVKILLVAALLLLTAKTMIVKTQSTYTQKISYSVTITPGKGHAHQQDNSSVKEP